MIVDGDIVFVEKGDYDVVNDFQAGYNPTNSEDGDSNGIVIDKNNVQFIGYESSATEPSGGNPPLSDLDSGDGVPDNYEEFYTPTSPDPNVPFERMPQLLGLGRGFQLQSAQGDPRIAGITILGDGVRFRNFRISNFVFGMVLSVADFCEVKNTVVDTLGDIETSDYSGWGIYLTGSKVDACDWCTVDNCFILNAAAEGIRVQGKHNTIIRTKVFCDDNSSQDNHPNGNTPNPTLQEQLHFWRSGTDYYIVINESSNNKILHCHLERRKDRNTQNYVYHPGRLAIETRYYEGEEEPGAPEANYVSENNIVEDCDMVNLGEPVTLRGFKTKLNKIRRITSTRDTNDPYTTNCLKLEGAPSENHFERIALLDSKYTIGVTADGPYQPLELWACWRKQQV